MRNVCFPITENIHIVEEKDMKTGEKKLGCLAGTVRTNQPWVGTIEGSVNNATMPKGGKKQVSIDKEGNVLFWIVNDFDVTVLPEDVVGCELVRNGIYVHGGPSIKRGETNIRTNWFGPMLKLSFAQRVYCVLRHSALSRTYTSPDLAISPELPVGLRPTESATSILETRYALRDISPTLTAITNP